MKKGWTTIQVLTKNVPLMSYHCLRMIKIFFLSISNKIEKVFYILYQKDSITVMTLFFPKYHQSTF